MLSSPSSSSSSSSSITIKDFHNGNVLTTKLPYYVKVNQHSKRHIYPLHEKRDIRRENKYVTSIGIYLHDDNEHYKALLNEFVAFATTIGAMSNVSKVTATAVSTIMAKIVVVVERSSIFNNVADHKETHSRCIELYSMYSGGWLVDWLAGSLARWLAGCLAGCPPSCSICSVQRHCNCTRTRIYTYTYIHIYIYIYIYT
uniref:Uncharacterized protein n=1 Tax=Glossina palpalis gambiensis TaxID=67801 RepID=A0A1B0AXV2_9MUSC